MKDEKQYEALKDRGMSKQRAARIANDPHSSKKGGKASGSGKQRQEEHRQQPGRHLRPEEEGRSLGRQGRSEEVLTA